MAAPTLVLEKALQKQGYRRIAGIDEVGRGSWAGPLVAAGVILPLDFKIPKGLADSKKVKPQLRAELAGIIAKRAIAVSIIEVHQRQIDRIGVGEATQVAFRKVVRHLSPSPDFCLIDAFYIKYYSRKKQLAVKNGDSLCASISAASIVAKVYRDKLMRKVHKLYPNYGFAKHKGYGTLFHQKAIKVYGFSEIHRTSFNLKYLVS